MANTYYVTVTGSDADDGSISTPWLTIGHAIDTAASGDTIYVGDGEYLDETSRGPIEKTLYIKAINGIGNVIVQVPAGDIGGSNFWLIAASYRLEIYGIVFNILTGALGARRVLRSSDDGIVLSYYCYFYCSNGTKQGVGISNYEAASGVSTLFAYKCTFRNLETGVGVEKLSLQTHGTVKDCLFDSCTNGLKRSNANYCTITENNNSFYNNDNNFLNGSIDASDLTSDPLFANSYNNTDGYKLYSTSPCMDAGVTVPTYVTTFIGTAPDIGCDEHGITTGDVTLEATLQKLQSSSVALQATLLKTQAGNATVAATLKKTLLESATLEACLAKIVGTPHRDSFIWEFPGLLCTGTQVGGTKFVGGPCVIKAIVVYLKGLGSANSTILDINKVNINGTTIASIFSDPNDRPTLAYNSASNLFFSFPDVALKYGEGLCIDIDSVATDAENLTVAIITESLSGKRPRVIENMYFEDEFKLSNDHLVYSSDLTIKLRFSNSMDTTVAPSILSFISKTDGVSDISLYDTKWESTYLPDDTFVVYNINITEAATFLLEVSGLKDKVGVTQEEFTNQVTFLTRDFLTVTDPYISTSTAILSLYCPTAVYMSFSLDNLTWSSWELSDITKNLDVTDTLIGGNASEGLKTVYARFKDSCGNVSLADTFDIYYYVSALACTLKVTPVKMNEYFITNNEFKSSYLLEWKPTSTDLIPLSKTELYFDGTLFDTIGFAPLWISGIVPTITRVFNTTPQAQLTEMEFKVTSTSGYIYDATGLFTTIQAESTGKSVIITDYDQDYVVLCYINSDHEFDIQVSAINSDVGLGLEDLTDSEKLQVIKDQITEPDGILLIGFIYLLGSSGGNGIVEDTLKSVYSPTGYFSTLKELGSGTLVVRLLDESGRYVDCTTVITSTHPKMQLKAYTDATKTTELTSGQIYEYDSVYYEWGEV